MNGGANDIQANAPALELRGVSYRYPPGGIAGERRAQAVDNVTLSLAQGERLGILGPNGGGKSTLLRLILGLLEPTEGEVRVFGLTPDEARRRRLVGAVPQRVEATLEWPISAREVVAMGPAVGVPPWKRLPAETLEAVEKSIELVGAAEFADRPIGKLSGGQLQRIMIARAIAVRPRLLLLDEPTGGIDVVGQVRFTELIDALHKELGLTIITVSHDLRTVAASSDRVACLRRTLHFHAAPGGLTPAILAEVFAHDVEAVFGEVHIDAHAAADCDDPSHQHDHAHDHGHGCGHGCQHGEGGHEHGGGTPS